MLLIDAGNTRLKWQLHSVTGVSSGSCEYYELDHLLRSFAGGDFLKPGVVLVSSVRGEEFELVFSQQCGGVLGFSPEFVGVQRSCCGVSVAYEDLSRLGVDRWLALLAANARAKHGCVVVDAGTAITVDYVAAGGKHLGGLIVPGIHLMGAALLRNTHSVSVKSLTLPQTWSPGCDTVACVEQGVAACLQGFVSGAVAADAFPGAAEMDSAKIFVCGGDSRVILPWLPTSRAVHAEHLVIDGLRLFYEESNG